MVKSKTLNFLNILRRQTCKSVQYVLGYSGFKSCPSFSMTLYYDARSEKHQHTAKRGGQIRSLTITRYDDKLHTHAPERCWLPRHNYT